MDIKSAKTALQTLAVSPAERKVSPLLEFLSATQEEIVAAREAGHSWRAIYDAIVPHITNETGKPTFSSSSFAKKASLQYHELQTKESEEISLSRESVPELHENVPEKLEDIPKVTHDPAKKKNFILSNGDAISQDLALRLGELFMRGFSAKRIAEVLNEERWEPVVGRVFTDRSVLALIDLLPKKSPPKKEYETSGVSA